MQEHHELKNMTTEDLKYYCVISNATMRMSVWFHNHQISSFISISRVNEVKKFPLALILYGEYLPLLIRISVVVVAYYS